MLPGSRQHGSNAYVCGEPAVPLVDPIQGSGLVCRVQVELPGLVYCLGRAPWFSNKAQCLSGSVGSAACELSFWSLHLLVSLQQGLCMVMGCRTIGMQVLGAEW